jgi:putative FmdB family regulatory protein
MPLYDYECEECSHRFELRRSFSEGASAKCPKCHSEAQRVFAPVPIVFKGSGFYVTDYRKDKGTAEEKPVGKPAESKAECKAECKPDSHGCQGSACKN